MIDRETGEIVHLVPGKGYGFIGVEGNDKHYFFLGKDVRGTWFPKLRLGDSVSFTPSSNERGQCAIDVQLMR